MLLTLLEAERRTSSDWRLLLSHELVQLLLKRFFLFTQLEHVFTFSAAQRRFALLFPEHSITRHQLKYS